MISCFLAHEGHTQNASNLFAKIIQLIGSFHLILLHFPIALVIMALISELLFLWRKNPLYDHAARFMIYTAAITAILTALLGFAFAYDAHYVGIHAELFWWHQTLGIITTLVCLCAAFTRELFAYEKVKSLKSYWVFLILAFVGVNLTGFFGGLLSFGQDLGLFR